MKTSRRIGWGLFYGGLFMLFGPFALGIVVFGFAAILGCEISTAGPRSCILFDTDIGEALGFLILSFMASNIALLLPGVASVLCSLFLLRNKK